MALTEGGLKLRSDTERDTYNSLVETTSADIDAGDMAAVNDVVGVWVNDSDSGDDNVLIYEASKIVVPCVAITSGTLTDYGEGSKVYFDSTNAEVTAVSAGNTLCGIVVDAPAVGDEEVLIHLMGALGIVS